MTNDLRPKLRDDFLALIRETPVLMGILNVTPDSFSDGGRYKGVDDAIRHAVAMAESECAIVDIGGELTRPGFAPVSESEELQRVAPVIATLFEKLAVPISIDTTKASVAREAARLGAVVVNDIWGLQKDPLMAGVIVETGSAAIVMHNRDQIDGSIDILDDIRRFFDRSLSIAELAGLPRDHLILDPGVGFGKTFEQNLACIRQLDRLSEYELPLLIGLSRKSFIGRLLQNNVEERLVGTLAANIVGLMRGASILRVHDVAEHQAALTIFKALKEPSHG